MYCDWTDHTQLIGAALVYVKPMQKSIGKSNIRPPVKPQPLKISTWNFAHVIMSGTTTPVQISVQIGSVRDSPHMERLFDCPVQKPEVVISQPWTEIPWRNLVHG